MCFGPLGCMQRGVPTDFPPSKIRQGYGDELVQVLNTLAQNALKASKWKWQAPVIRADAGDASGATDQEAADGDLDASTDHGASDDIVGQPVFF